MRYTSRSVYSFLAASLGVFICCTPATPNQANAGHPAEVAERSGPTKLALIVGINDYPHLENLKGAVNDAENVKNLLVESFGFLDDEAHIRFLSDSQATREAILTGLDEHLIKKAREAEESIVVFHFSGHGSRKGDEAGEAGDETDGYDETIVPHDSSHAPPIPNRDITDDEINARLRTLTDITPNVTFIFDSCHSGAAVRGSGLARTVKGDPRFPKPEQATRGAREGKSDWRPDQARYALLSGCRADQLSREMVVDGKSYGAMSWFLVDQIRNTKGKATYDDIMDKVKVRVSAKYSNQHPQLEGIASDQFVFSDDSRPAAGSFVKAFPAGRRQVTLRAGQVHGVSEDSIYDIYAPGTDPLADDASRIAQVKVTDVRVTTSKAKLIEGDSIEEASLAVEREHSYLDASVAVYFKTPGPKLREIMDELKEFKHIKSVPTESGYDLLIEESNGFIITEGGEPTEISPRVAVTDPEATSRVVEQVTKWTKWLNILFLENDSHDLGLEFEVSASEARGGNLEDREVDLTLLDGDRFTIEVTNKSNRRMYIAVLDLSSDGSVDLIYPEIGQEEFVAKDETWTKTLESFVPEGRDSVRDVLKVFATTEPADFKFLRQSAVRGGRELPRGSGDRKRNPLEQLMANYALGTTRGVRRVPKLSWVTAERVLEIRGE